MVEGSLPPLLTDEHLNELESIADETLKLPLETSLELIAEVRGLRERETALGLENKTLREARDRGDAVYVQLERLCADLTARETVLTAALAGLLNVIVWSEHSRSYRLDGYDQVTLAVNDAENALGESGF